VNSLSDEGNQYFRAGRRTKRGSETGAKREEWVSKSSEGKNKKDSLMR
jgi:hypothetical protein